MKISEKKTRKQPYRMGHQEYGTADQFLAKLEPKIIGPVQMMQECEGDMYLSDYQKLVGAYWLIKNRKD
jgi:hypothetical protein